MKTEKLYLKDVYLQKTYANIIDIVEDEKGISLVLDVTIFFHEGGGQPCDLGKIGNSNILHVFEKNNTIYHRVDKVPDDKHVYCVLDYARRFDHMQQHCGEHILSGMFLKEYNLYNKGFHLGEDYTTIDIDVKSLDKEMIDNIERLSNEMITKNYDIIIKTVDSLQEANEFGLRKIPTVVNDIRIVKVDNVDVVACCGTHPNKTGEVGIIKIIKWQKYKNMTRVFFLCGMRAINDYMTKHDLLSTINKIYSADIKSILDRIQKEKEKIVELKKEVKANREILCKQVSLVLCNNVVNNVICKLYVDKNFEQLNTIAKYCIGEDSKNLVILASLLEYKIIITTDEYDFDCGKFFKENLKKYNGRGGGGKTKAQGFFQNQDDLRNFYEKIKDEIAYSE